MPRRPQLATKAVACAALFLGTTGFTVGCTSGSPSMPRPVAPVCATCPPGAPDARANDETVDRPVESASVPDAIQAWMDRLTIAHEYDPATGFIVAREVVPLPASIETAPPLRDSIVLARERGLPLIAFATADRCAPCQQFKRDALNDRRVIERLAADDIMATHIEVDRDPVAAREFLGGPAIPMTYLIRDGVVVATLRGQRTADELLAWLAGID